MSKFSKFLGAAAVTAVIGLASSAAQATVLIDGCLNNVAGACTGGASLSYGAPVSSPFVWGANYLGWITTTTAYADPTIQQPDFNTTSNNASLSTTTVSVNNGSQLYVWVTATGLTIPQGVNTFESSFTNNIMSNLSLVQESTYIDITNAAYGTGTLLATVAFPAIGTNIQYDASPNLSGPFSETELYVLTVACPGGAGSCSSQGLFTIATNLITPEPLTLSVFGAGLAGLAGLRRRRKAVV